MNAAPVRTKRDHVVAELQRLVVSGEIPRGAALQQDELARRFNTSITPVREALRLLESEGVVVSAPHRGVRVAAPDPERLKATYVMRRLLETHAMQRAALRVSRRDLAVARAHNDAMALAIDAGDDLGVRERNRAFHFHFYERCGRAPLVERIRGLWLVFPWEVLLVSRCRAGTSVHEHAALCDAIAAGELADVTRLMEAHVLGGYRSLMHALDPSFDDADPFDPEAD